MLLPKQVEPVSRVTRETPQRPGHEETVPQVTCFCRLDSAGVYKWFCLLGRDLLNTGYNCTPTS